MSKSETLATQTLEAPRAGADLREARERLGWNLADVAAMLRIRPSYLEALEAGRLNRLPGNVYALGFLRSYATALGLDVEEVARRFRAEAGDIPRHSELIFPTPMPERGLPAGALILLGLILVGGTYIGWYRLSGEGKLPAETVAPVPARLAALVDQARHAPDQRSSAASGSAASGDQQEPTQGTSSGPSAQAGPVTPASPPADDTRMASIPGATATTAIAMPLPPPVRQPDPVPPPVVAPPVPAVSAPAPDVPRVVLRFTGDTWVQVKQRGGQALITKVMKAGDSFTVPTEDNLILNTGNAGRVEILVDGNPVPPIGGPGAVRHDVSLDPDSLKAGPIVPVSTRHQ